MFKVRFWRQLGNVDYKVFQNYCIRLGYGIIKTMEKETRF